MTGRLTIVEVGPRDGLQNEPDPIATAEKVALIDALSATGLARIEAAAFVSPRAVPQMADGTDVMARIARPPGVRFSALVPNLRGLQTAIAAGVDEVAVFAAASETFSQRNINATITESLARFEPVAEGAREAGIALRGYVSTVVHCPYEGAVAPAAVARVALALVDLGAVEISLGDTTGQGTPETIAPMLDAVLERISADRLAGHFHDTNGRALESVALALDRGITVFDTAAGGLGGCPFAPGARGNLATGRLVDWARTRGIETGIDRDALGRAEAMARAMSTRLTPATGAPGGIR